MLKKKKRRKLRLFVIFIFLLIFGLSVLSGLWSLEAIGSDRCCVSSTCVKTPRLVSGRIGSQTLDSSDHVTETGPMYTKV